jgi:very-short-patch-repair endonuclease
VARKAGLPEALDKAVASLARRQHGYVTRRQLTDLGMSEQGIRTRLGTGRLIPVYAGVYAVGHLPNTPLAHAAAAVLACGPGTLLSHGSGAALWAFRKRWPTPIEVTATSAHRRAGIKTHRSATLTKADVTRHLGIPVTSPARTLLDVAATLTDKALTRAVNEALLSNYLHESDLRALIERCRTHPQATRIEAVIAEDRSRSWLEDEFRPWLRRFKLPEPRFNVLVNGREVDVYFPHERLIVELDGYEVHRGRAAFEDDRDRDADMLVNGMPTVRITRRRIRSAPANEAERLRSILQDRRP